ncbi:MAG TPA: adenylate/guanylate cyclase domain-containing protein [Solirubrobacteraceae bacterium]|jgi:adenylate cyclase|nr:adenylate/guanylate cyclase domain-containing protein [Solirubrobacteraceae bacterium]
MRCRACGQPHPEDLPACPACGAPTADRPAAASRARVEPAPPPPAIDPVGGLRGERKLITVLFIDVVGSMKLSEDLSSDIWATVVDDFLTAVERTVAPFGGAVDKFTGDGALVLFGARQATEDHARRACLAALELRGALERLGDAIAHTHTAGFRVRMGINSGEVVVGHLRGSRHAPEVIGHTVGLAQRVQALAPPGCVYLSEQTAALVEDEFALEELGPARVKGTHRPVRVFALQGLARARTRHETPRRREWSSFVGRDVELAELEAALEAACDGDGQVIELVGDPGVGKSRLCREFVDRCRARDLTVITASVTALGRMRPLGPVLEMLRATFATEADTPPDRVRDQIRRTFDTLGDHVAERTDLMWDFMGVTPADQPLPPIDPDARRRRVIELIGDMVHARSAREPAVEIVEDVHWMDDASQPFLDGLIEAVRGTRTLLVITHRTGYASAQLAAAHCRLLPLMPLTHVSSELLVNERLGDDASLDDLAQQMERSSEGNPFFIEELVRNLVEQGTIDGEPGDYRRVAPLPRSLPPSVESVLAARIDRLPETDKRLLQTASVIGREFDPALLAAVAGGGADTLDASLTALCAAALVDRLENGICSFRHALTREVAHSSLLTTDRRRLHALVAQATIELLNTDSLNEQAALIAYHLEAAGEPGPAAQWNARAAGWVGLSHPATALAHWREVSRLTSAVPADEQVVRLAMTAALRSLTLSWRLGAGADEVADLYAQSRDLARRVGSVGAEALAVGNYAAVLGFSGHGRSFLELSEEAVALGERSGDLGILQTTRAPLQLSLIHRGRLDEALAVGRAMHAAARDHPDAGAGLALDSPLAWSHYSQALSLMYMGEHAASRDLFEAAIAQAETDNNLEVVCWSSAHLTSVLHALGDIAGARESSTRAVAIAERAGDGLSLALSYSCLSALESAEGHTDAAASNARRTLAIVEEHHAGRMLEPLAHAQLAATRLALGDLAGGHREAQLAVDLARSYESVIYQIAAELVLARALRSIGEADRADALLAEVEQAIDETGARSFSPGLEAQR